MLRAFRGISGRSLEQVDSNLRRRVEDARAELADEDLDGLDHQARQLESTRSVDELALTVAGLQVLADAYEIPRLMLDPLIATPSNSVCVVENFSDFREIQAPNHHETACAAYRIPITSLADTDEVALVHLELKEGGATRLHAHPGSELLIVLAGVVEIRLAQSGVWNRLEAGEYAHYYSSQPHSVVNRGVNRASAFVIRFYQVAISGSRGSRLAFLEEIAQLLKEIGTPRATKRSAYVLSRVAEELSPAAPSSNDCLPFEQREVVDRFGLAQLLRLVCEGRFQGGAPVTLQELSDRAESHGLNFNRSRIDRLHHGLTPVRASELPALADLYRVEPFLFLNFLYPTVRDFVAVRPSSSDAENDYDLVDAMSGSGVHFRLPRRRLADSDMAIVLVELEPGCTTPVNRHPGHELIVPLEGTVEVRFGNMNQVLDSPKGSYAHYHSRIDHCTRNAGMTLARFLVIRFHE